MRQLHLPSWAAAALGLALSPWMAACGDGGAADAMAGKAPTDAATPCERYNAVQTGFTGDLNTEGAQGGDPGGGDPSGSAGVGGGLGKVLGAKVEVARLSDGLKFNSGTDVFTDRVTGLARIQTCDVRQPLLITLTGVDGATYYDEGKNAMLPFGPDQEIHALVSKVDGHIGVSALTEAAYRYAVNQFASDPRAIEKGASPLLKKAGPEALSRLTLEQIEAANQRVADEVNRVLPANYRLASITALPTPLGLDNQSAGLIPQNRYGLAALVTGGFGWMADKFRIGSQRPTLDMVEEFARDLTDGRLDGLALGGAPASPAAGSTYDPVNIPIGLNVGANFIAEQFSQANLEAASRYVDATAFDENMSCNTTWNRFALTRQGTIELNRQRYKKNDAAGANNCVAIGAPAFDPEFTRKAGSNVKEIFTSHNTGGGFFVKDDGQVFSWGNSVCGQLADGESVGIRYEPRAIRGLNNVTSLANGYNFSVARDNDGHVYSWGSGKFGVLGLGGGPLPGAVPCVALKFGDAVHEAAATPRRVPGLEGITHVFVAHFSKVFALDKAGRLYNWGFGCGREGFRTEDGLVNTWSGTPRLLEQPAPVRAVAANVRGCFALKADGTLVGWGFHNGVRNAEGTYDDGQWFGDGQATAKVRPTPLPGLSDVREIASDEYYFYALKSDGSLWRWGGSTDGRNTLVGTPTRVIGIAPSTPGGEVRFRHIKSDLDGARFFAQDGRIFVAKAWGAAPHNTLDALEYWGFK